MTLWIALSAAVHAYLARTGRAAIPILAGLMAAGLGVAGILQFANVARLPVGTEYKDTYYIVSHGYFLLNMAIFYLVVTGCTRVIWKLAQGWSRRLLAPAFWLYHLGIACVVLPTLLARFFIPRSYVDYPHALYWPNLMSAFGAQFSFLGLVCLLALTAIALGQGFIERRTP